MKYLVAILALLLSATAAKSSFASLTVCNQRSVTGWIAEAHYQASVTSVSTQCGPAELESPCFWSDWKVDAWWELAPGACAVVIGSNLTNRYLYLHVDYSDGSKVAGGTGFQVEQPAFSWDEDTTTHGSNCIETSVVDPACAATYNGGFREIDVGNNTTYTVDLTN